MEHRSTASEDMNSYFTEEEIHETSKYTERCPSSPAFWEMQIHCRVDLSVH